MELLLLEIEEKRMKLFDAREHLDTIPQMLDNGAYVASYGITTFENQGTLNPAYDDYCLEIREYESEYKKSLEKIKFVEDNEVLSSSLEKLAKYQFDVFNIVVELLVQRNYPNLESALKKVIKNSWTLADAAMYRIEELQKRNQRNLDS